MNRAIVSCKGAVTLVGAGECTDNVLSAALARAGCIVAADGGAGRVMALGHLPDAVIGDMDSLSPGLATEVPPDRVHRIDEQDSTDFDKALRHIAAPLVLGYGFLGARLDHQLAAMTVLAARCDRRCILVGEADVVALCPPRLRLDLAPETRVSLFPLAPVTARSDGLRWPVEGLDFAPAGRIGTSNRANGAVTLEVVAPEMLLILPAACLNALQAALADAPATWPARA